MKYDNEKIIELLKSGLKHSEIKDIIGCSMGYISNIANLNNLKRHDSHNLGKGRSMRYGYITIYVEGKWKSEHNVIMEQSIGRKLTKDEIVHHINENKIDNRIENLQLLTKSEHVALHNSTRDYSHIANPIAIRKLYLEGNSGRKIALILGIGKTTVLDCIKELGISRKNTERKVS